MHIFSNTKFRPATVSISFFCLALLFSGGCGNNKGKLYLTPVEQAAADKYLKKYGRDDVIRYYLMEEWGKMEMKMNEVLNNKTDDEIDENFKALLEEAKKQAGVEDGRILSHVKYFMAQGADLNLKPKRPGGDTLLHTVTVSGNLGLVQFLVSKGADVNAKGEYGITPMSLAAVYDHDEIVRFLVSKGADMDVRDSSGLTPLCTAVITRRFEIVKFLVSKGADVNAKDNDGRTPLYWAEGHPEISEFLISKGAKLE